MYGFKIDFSVMWLEELCFTAHYSWNHIAANERGRVPFY